MRTKTIELYDFDELSDKAKEKAREWWREGESQEFGAFGDLYEPAETAAKLLGIEFKRHDVPLLGGSRRSEPCIWWQLHTQGSGASFDGSYSFRKGSVASIKAEFPTDTGLLDIAKALARLQKKYGYKLTATISTSGREVHKYAMKVEAFDSHGDRIDDADEKDLLDAMRDFADWIYQLINAEYIYRMSDEVVDDTIQANGYTFTANGERMD